jgi:hypothetical protein
VNVALIDAMARHHFKRIGIDRDWGPENSTWVKHFPSFHSDYQGIVRQWATEVPLLMADALTKSLTESELKDIQQTLEVPAFSQQRDILAQLGLDLQTAVQLLGVSSSPYAYSKHERNQLKEKQARAKGLEAQPPEVKARIDAARQLLLTPTMVKFNKLVTETLLSRLQALETREPGKSPMRTFLLQWRTRINLE